MTTVIPRPTVAPHTRPIARAERLPLRDMRESTGRLGGDQNSGSNPVAAGLITPDELRRIADENEMEKVREALEKKR